MICNPRRLCATYYPVWLERASQTSGFAVYDLHLFPNMILGTGADTKQFLFHVPQTQHTYDSNTLVRVDVLRPGRRTRLL